MTKCNIKTFVATLILCVFFNGTLIYGMKDDHINSNPEYKNNKKENIYLNLNNDEEEQSFSIYESCNSKIQESSHSENKKKNEKTIKKNKKHNSEKINGKTKKKIIKMKKKIKSKKMEKIVNGGNNDNNNITIPKFPEGEFYNENNQNSLSDQSLQISKYNVKKKSKKKSKINCLPYYLYNKNGNCSVLFCFNFCNGALSNGEKNSLHKYKEQYIPLNPSKKCNAKHPAIIINNVNNNSQNGSANPNGGGPNQ